MSSLEKGELGIGSLSAFNLALLQKWRWRFLTQQESGWVHLIKSIHGIDGGFSSTCKSKFSGVWVNLVDFVLKLDGKNVIPLNTIHKKVGEGDSTLFWHDTWVGGTTF